MTEAQMKKLGDEILDSSEVIRELFRRSENPKDEAVANLLMVVGRAIRVGFDSQSVENLEKVITSYLENEILTRQIQVWWRG